MSNIQPNASQATAKMQLEVGASHQSIESFIISVIAQLSADAKYAPALPAVINSRLPINPEHAPLSGEHWMISPSFIDDNTGMPRGTPLTIAQYQEELAREIEEAELVAQTEAETAAAEAAVVEVAEKKRKRHADHARAEALKKNRTATTPVRGGLAGLGTTLPPEAATPTKSPTTPVDSPTTPRTPFRATIIDAYQSQMPSLSSHAGRKSSALEKIMTSVRTDQIKAYVAIVPAVIALICSNLSPRTLSSMTSNAEWTQAVGRQDLVRLWYVLLRHVTFYYTTPELTITYITSDLQCKPEYKLGKDEPFIDYANRWTIALKHILFADHQFKQAALVIHFIRGIPATQFQQLRRELVDPRTYPSPHLHAARNSLALCINEFAREIQMQRQLEPMHAASESKTILALTADINRLKQQMSAGRGGGGGGRGRGDQTGRGSQAGRGSDKGRGGGGRGATLDYDIDCVKHSRGQCFRGDTCKYRHGLEDPRWAGDVMKPDALAAVKQAIEKGRAERETRKVNFLTQHAISGTGTEEQDA